MSNTNFVEIMGHSVAYKTYGEGEINVVYLHGWASNKETFESVIAKMKHNEKLKFTSLDFPAFGESSMPSEILDTEDYKKIVLEFIKKMKLENIILIGHSFGGRVSIKIASSVPNLVNKLVLTDSAGIKPKRKPSYYFKVWSYKLSKALLKTLYRGEKFDKKMKKLYKKYGSEDYRNSNDITRKILVKVVNEDLTSLLPEIKAPTLLMWGENDTDTPLWMAKKMEKLIPNAGLVLLKNAGHYSFIDNSIDFAIILNKFIFG
jgi:pimeloyl-ACP methyl ester carboxylesterase